MSDITMIRGYGFPRGGAMDYAGYRGFAGNPNPNAGDLNYGPVRFEGPTASQLRIQSMPDPSVFAPIPALDGIFCEEGYGPVRFGAFGTELTLGPITMTPDTYYGPSGIGTDGLMHYPDGTTCDPSVQSCPQTPAGNAVAGNAALLGWGLAAVGLFLWMNR